MRILALVLFALTALAGASVACVCVDVSGADPILSACDAYKRSSVVFVGTVTDIDDLDGRRETTFDVMKRFRGGKGMKAVVIGTGSDCDFEFENGETYFVYAGLDREGRLMSGACGRTQLLATAAADLYHAHRAAAPARGPGPIRGRAVLAVSAGAGRVIWFPLAGVPITIAGPRGQLAVVSGIDGTFKVNDPAPGPYVVHASLAPRFSQTDDVSFWAEDGDCGNAATFRTSAIEEPRLTP
jgi:hypothetical protein